MASSAGGVSAVPHWGTCIVCMPLTVGDLHLRYSSSQDRLIEEQQRIMGELYKERQALAEEKTKFLLEQKLTQDKEHRDSLKHLKVSLSWSV